MSDTANGAGASTLNADGSSPADLAESTAAGVAATETTSTAPGSDNPEGGTTPDPSLSTGGTEGGEGTATKHEEAVPYARFSEVNKKYTEATAAMEALKAEREADRQIAAQWQEAANFLVEKEPRFGEYLRVHKNPQVAMSRFYADYDRNLQAEKAYQQQASELDQLLGTGTNDGLIDPSYAAALKEKLDPYFREIATIKPLAMDWQQKLDQDRRDADMVTAMAGFDRADKDAVLAELYRTKGDTVAARALAERLHTAAMAPVNTLADLEAKHAAELKEALVIRRADIDKAIADYNAKDATRRASSAVQPGTGGTAPAAGGGSVSIAPEPFLDNGQPNPAFGDYLKGVQKQRTYKATLNR